MHIPLDFAEEVSDQSSLRHAVDLGVDVFELKASVVAFAIGVIVRIINDIDQAVVAHATRESRVNNLRDFALPDLTWDSCKGGITHLDIVIRPVKVILQQQPTAKVMLNVSRTPPSIALRCLEADVWGISEGWIDTVQVPIRVTKVALEHLALAATG